MMETSQWVSLELERVDKSKTLRFCHGSRVLSLKLGFIERDKLFQDPPLLELTLLRQDTDQNRSSLDRRL